MSRDESGGRVEGNVARQPESRERNAGNISPAYLRQHIPILLIAEKAFFCLYRSLTLKGEEIKFVPMERCGPYLETCNTDLIILDDGFRLSHELEVLRHLKQNRAEIPVIFITDDISSEAALAAFRAGARDVFQKPFNIIELSNTILYLLSVKRGSRERRASCPIDHSSVRGTVANSATTEKPSHIIRSIQYMEEHLGEALTLDQLAAAANLSKFHFCRNFRASIGISPFAFIRDLRIQRAKELFQHVDMNVTTVAEQTGFNDIGTFIRQFKRLTGTTPAAYRRAHQKRSLPQARNLQPETSFTNPFEIP